MRASKQQHRTKRWLSSLGSSYKYGDSCVIYLVMFATLLVTFFPMCSNASFDADVYTNWNSTSEQHVALARDGQPQLCTVWSDESELRVHFNMSSLPSSEMNITVSSTLVRSSLTHNLSSQFIVPAGDTSFYGNDLASFSPLHSTATLSANSTEFSIYHVCHEPGLATGRLLLFVTNATYSNVYVVSFTALCLSQTSPTCVRGESNPDGTCRCDAGYTTTVAQDCSFKFEVESDLCIGSNASLTFSYAEDTTPINIYDWIGVYHLPYSKEGDGHVFPNIFLPLITQPEWHTLLDWWYTNEENPQDLVRSSTYNRPLLEQGFYVFIFFIDNRYEPLAWTTVSVHPHSMAECAPTLPYLLHPCGPYGDQKSIEGSVEIYCECHPGFFGERCHRGCDTENPALLSSAAGAFSVSADGTSIYKNNVTCSWIIDSNSSLYTPTSYSITVSGLLTTGEQLSIGPLAEPTTGGNLSTPVSLASTSLVVGTTLIDTTIHVESEAVLFKFVSDLTYQFKWGIEGFHVRWVANGCPEGYYLKWNELPSLDGSPQWERYDCEPCPAGSYSTSKDSFKCVHCPKNTYSNSEGQTLCLDCPKGAFSSSGALSCRLCMDEGWENDGCPQPYELKLVAVSVLAVLTTVSFLTIAAASWFLFKNWNNIVVFGSHRCYLILTLAGCFIMTLVCAMLQFPHTDIICATSTVLIPAGAQLIFISFVALVVNWRLQFSQGESLHQIVRKRLYGLMAFPFALFFVIMCTVEVVTGNPRRESDILPGCVNDSNKFIPISVQMFDVSVLLWVLYQSSDTATVGLMFGLGHTIQVETLLLLFYRSITLILFLYQDSLSYSIYTGCLVTSMLIVTLCLLGVIFGSRISYMTAFKKYRGNEDNYRVQLSVKNFFGMERKALSISEPTLTSRSATVDDGVDLKSVRSVLEGREPDSKGKDSHSLGYHHHHVEQTPPSRWRSVITPRSTQPSNQQRESNRTRTTATDSIDPQKKMRVSPRYYSSTRDRGKGQGCDSELESIRSFRGRNVPKLVLPPEAPKPSSKLERDSASTEVAVNGVMWKREAITLRRNSQSSFVTETETDMMSGSFGTESHMSVDKQFRRGVGSAILSKRLSDGSDETVQGTTTREQTLPPIMDVSSLIPSVDVESENCSPTPSPSSPIRRLATLNSRREKQNRHQNLSPTPSPRLQISNRSEVNNVLLYQEDATFRVMEKRFKSMIHMLRKKKRILSDSDRSLIVESVLSVPMYARINQDLFTFTPADPSEEVLHREKALLLRRAVGLESTRTVEKLALDYLHDVDNTID